MQDLRTAQMYSQKPINHLASELAALKAQMAAKELSWQQEQQKMIRPLKSVRERRTKPREMVEVISSPSQSPNQDSPAEEVQVKEHQQTLSTQLQDLRTAQPDSQKPDNQLVAEIAALKELMAAKELSWEQERQKIMKALRSEIERRKLVQAKKNVTEKEMVEVTSSPSQSPNQDSPAEEVQVKEHQQTLSTQLQDLTTAQPDSQKPDHQLVSENAALKELMAAKELSWEQERQKLQRQSREMEEWCNHKEEQIKLLTQQNADLQVHSLSLRELAQQTDKEKAQFKKEEKKAAKEAEKILKKDRKEAEKILKKDRKEAEKILKKDRKEEEEREKNEKKENEKREKEEVKRQKKRN